MTLKDSPGAGHAALPETSSLLGERLPPLHTPAGDEASAIVFEARLPGAGTQFLRDHVVGGRIILPGAAYVSMMASAAQQACAADPDAAAPMALQQIQFLRTCDLSDAPLRLQTRLRRDAGPGWQISVLAWNDDSESWDSCASARWMAIATQDTPAAAAAATAIAIAEAADLPGDNAARRYHDLAATGLNYGPAFQTLVAQQRSGDRVAGRIEAPRGHPAARQWPSRHLHPAVLDGAFQTLTELLRDEAAAYGMAPLPVGIEAFELFVDNGAPLPATVQVESRLRERPTGTPDEAGQQASPCADLLLRDEQGRLLARVRGLSLRWVNTRALAARNASPVQAYGVAWQAHAALPAAGAGSNVTPGWCVLHQPATDQALASALAAQGLPVSAMLPLAAASAARLDAHFAQQPGCTGVLLWLDAIAPLAHSADDNSPEDGDPTAQSIALCEQVQGLVLALQNLAAAPPGLKVCVVSRAGSGAAGPTSAACVAHAAVGGLLRSAPLEMLPFKLMHVDMPAEPAASDLATLATVLQASDETAAAIVDGQALVPRLRLLGAGSTPPPRPPGIHADAAYLVTGGTGGLGLEIAQWLADAGATRIDLVGRRAVLDEAAMARIDELLERGVEVCVHQADLSERDNVRRLISQLSAGPRPLRGIVHASGVTDDRPLASIDAASWSRVMNAKLRSAWLLEQETEALALDFSIAFSSIAAVFGSPGQANYAATNAALDALMHERRRLHGTGTRINWGPWADAGMASAPQMAERLRRQGLPPMRASHALAALNGVMLRGDAQAVILHLDSPTFAASLPPGGVASVLRGTIDNATPQNAAERLGLPSAEALAALPGPEAAPALLQALGRLVSGALRAELPRDPAELGQLRIAALGVDSLLAMEIRGRIRAWLAVDVPAHLLIGGARMAELAESIHQKMLLRSISVAAEDDTVDQGEDTEVFVL